MVTPPPSQLTLERHGRHDGKLSCSQQGVASSLILEEPIKVDATHGPMRNGNQDLRATETSIGEDEVSPTATTGLKGMEAAAGAAGLSPLAETTPSASERKKHNDENALAAT
ncbi:unnamed protein product, partial [Symbiodinium sp. CCMP2456]